MADVNEAEEARRLLDNGFQIVIFRDGMGTYSALAVRKSPEGDPDLNGALDDWREYESPLDVPFGESIFVGPNRYCGCGMTGAQALHAVAEKVLLRRLPG